MSAKKQSEPKEILGLNRITKKRILELCKRDKLYQTPQLNDVLYLHYQGFQCIECLEDYTELKCLWLECNAISEIQGLENQTKLKCLYLQSNLIRKIENLEFCKELDTINLSQNQIRKIENLGIDVLPVLNTLNIASNYIKDAEGLRDLENCKNLSVLDLSNNRIDDILVVKVFAKMPELKVLVLTGNPVVSKIPQYRKTLILECKKLTYLDQRPVFPKDRACAEAWKRGGYEEERKENERWNRAERRKMRDSVNATIRLRNKYRKPEDHMTLLVSSDSEDEATQQKRRRQQDVLDAGVDMELGIWDEVAGDDDGVKQKQEVSSTSSSSATSSSTSVISSTDSNASEDKSSNESNENVICLAERQNMGEILRYVEKRKQGEIEEVKEMEEGDVLSIEKDTQLKEDCENNPETTVVSDGISNKESPQKDLQSDPEDSGSPREICNETLDDILNVTLNDLSEKYPPQCGPRRVHLQIETMDTNNKYDVLDEMDKAMQTMEQGGKTPREGYEKKLQLLQPNNSPKSVQEDDEFSPLNTQLKQDFEKISTNMDMQMAQLQREQEERRDILEALFTQDQAAHETSSGGSSSENELPGKEENLTLHKMLDQWDKDTKLRENEINNDDNNERSLREGSCRWKCTEYLISARDRRDNGMSKQEISVRVCEPKYHMEEINQERLCNSISNERGEQDYENELGESILCDYTNENSVGEQGNSVRDHEQDENALRDYAQDSHMEEINKDKSSIVMTTSSNTIIQESGDIMENTDKQTLNPSDMKTTENILKMEEAVNQMSSRNEFQYQPLDVALLTRHSNKAMDSLEREIEKLNALLQKLEDENEELYKESERQTEEKANGELKENLLEKESSDAKENEATKIGDITKKEIGNLESTENKKMVIENEGEHCSEHLGIEEVDETVREDIGGVVSGENKCEEAIMDNAADDYENKVEQTENLLEKESCYGKDNKAAEEIEDTMKKVDENLESSENNTMKRENKGEFYGEYLTFEEVGETLRKGIDRVESGENKFEEAIMETEGDENVIQEGENKNLVGKESCDAEDCKAKEIGDTMKKEIDNFEFTDNKIKRENKEKFYGEYSSFKEVEKTLRADIGQVIDENNAFEAANSETDGNERENQEEQNENLLKKECCGDKDNKAAGEMGDIVKEKTENLESNENKMIERENKEEHYAEYLCLREDIGRVVNGEKKLEEEIMENECEGHAKENTFDEEDEAVDESYLSSENFEIMEGHDDKFRENYLETIVESLKEEDGDFTPRKIKCEEKTLEMEEDFISQSEEKSFELIMRENAEKRRENKLKEKSRDIVKDNRKEEFADIDGIMSEYLEDYPYSEDGARWSGNGNAISGAITSLRNETEGQEKSETTLEENRSDIVRDNEEEQFAENNEIMSEYPEKDDTLKNEKGDVISSVEIKFETFTNEKEELFNVNTAQLLEKKRNGEEQMETSFREKIIDIVRDSGEENENRKHEFVDVTPDGGTAGRDNNEVNFKEALDEEIDNIISREDKLKQITESECREQFNKSVKQRKDIEIVEEKLKETLEEKTNVVEGDAGEQEIDKQMNEECNDVSSSRKRRNQEENLNLENESERKNVAHEIEKKDHGNVCGNKQERINVELNGNCTVIESDAGEKEIEKQTKKECANVLSAQKRQNEEVNSNLEERGEKEEECNAMCGEIKFEYKILEDESDENVKEFEKMGQATLWNKEEEIMEDKLKEESENTVSDGDNEFVREIKKENVNLVNALRKEKNDVLPEDIEFEEKIKANFGETLRKANSDILQEDIKLEENILVIVGQEQFNKNTKHQSEEKNQKILRDSGHETISEYVREKCEDFIYSEGTKIAGESKEGSYAGNAFIEEIHCAIVEEQADKEFVVTKLEERMEEKSTNVREWKTDDNIKQIINTILKNVNENEIKVEQERFEEEKSNNVKESQPEENSTEKIHTFLKNVNQNELEREQERFEGEKSTNLRECQTEENITQIINTILGNVNKSEVEIEQEIFEDNLKATMQTGTVIDNEERNCDTSGATPNDSEKYQEPVSYNEFEPYKELANEEEISIDYNKPYVIGREKCKKKRERETSGDNTIEKSITSLNDPKSDNAAKRVKEESSEKKEEKENPNNSTENPNETRSLIDEDDNKFSKIESCHKEKNTSEGRELEKSGDNTVEKNITSLNDTKRDNATKSVKGENSEINPNEKEEDKNSDEKHIGTGSHLEEDEHKLSKIKVVSENLLENDCKIREHTNPQITNECISESHFEVGERTAETLAESSIFVSNCELESSIDEEDSISVNGQEIIAGNVGIEMIYSNESEVPLQMSLAKEHLESDRKYNDETMPESCSQNFTNEVKSYSPDDSLSNYSVNYNEDLKNSNPSNSDFINLPLTRTKKQLENECENIDETMPESCSQIPTNDVKTCSPGDSLSNFSDNGDNGDLKNSNPTNSDFTNIPLTRTIHNGLESLTDVFKESSKTRKFVSTESEKIASLKKLAQEPNLKLFNQDTHESLDKLLAEYKEQENRDIQEMINRVYAQRERYEDTIELVDGKLMIVHKDTGELKELTKPKGIHYSDSDNNDYDTAESGNEGACCSKPRKRTNLKEKTHTPKASVGQETSWKSIESDSEDDESSHGDTRMLNFRSKNSSSLHGVLSHKQSWNSVESDSENDDNDNFYSLDPPSQSNILKNIHSEFFDKLSFDHLKLSRQDEDHIVQCSRSYTELKTLFNRANETIERALTKEELDILKNIKIENEHESQEEEEHLQESGATAIESDEKIQEEYLLNKMVQRTKKQEIAKPENTLNKQMDFVIEMKTSKEGVKLYEYKWDEPDQSGRDNTKRTEVKHMSSCDDEREQDRTDELDEIEGLEMNVPNEGACGDTDNQEKQSFNKRKERKRTMKVIICKIKQKIKKFFAKL
ncbi:defective transmitter release isoform X2 [Musca autumnalis]|uniref:defective transmitter release isoform X2 n=1 Tax=Musca autumnalis TaxID=221902 RepID=UPI003CF7A8AD